MLNKFKVKRFEKGTKEGKLAIQVGIILKYL
jgi:hypothetical protein